LLDQVGVAIVEDEIPTPEIVAPSGPTAAKDLPLGCPFSRTDDVELLLDDDWLLELSDEDEELL